MRQLLAINGRTEQHLPHNPQPQEGDEDKSTYVLLDLAALGRSPIITEALAPGQQIELHVRHDTFPNISIGTFTLANEMLCYVCMHFGTMHLAKSEWGLASTL